MNIYLAAIKRGAIKGATEAPRDFFLPLVMAGRLARWLVRRFLRFATR